MIRHDGRAVLCDFGLAQVLDEEFERLASQSSHRGTLRWTSPERLSQDGPLAPPSDVWSWAWLIWQFLTEKDPFHSINNHTIVMYRIMSLRLPTSEQEPVILEIPTLSRLLELCWQKDPASRLRIDECIERLERIFEQPKMSRRSQEQPHQLVGSSGGFHPIGTLSVPPNPPPKALSAPLKDGFEEPRLPDPPKPQPGGSIPPSGVFIGRSPPRSTVPNHGLPHTPGKDTNEYTPTTPGPSERPRQGTTSENQPNLSQLPNQASRTGFRKFTKLLLSISKRKPQQTNNGEEISGWDIVDPQPALEALGNEKGPTNPADAFLEVLSEHPRHEQIKILSDVLRKFGSTEEISHDIANYIDRLNRWLSEVPVFGSPDMLGQPRALPPRTRHQPGTPRTPSGPQRDVVEELQPSAVFPPVEGLKWAPIPDSSDWDVSQPPSPSTPPIKMPEPIARDIPNTGIIERVIQLRSQRIGVSVEASLPPIRRLTQSEIKMYPSTGSDGKDKAQAGVILVTGKAIAIKPVNFHPDSGEAASEISIMSEFEKWLGLWASLEHENIAKLLGSVLLNDTPSVITERCNGGNIAQYLKKNPTANKRNLLRQVAQGLNYLHTVHPTTHSNLKPNNVLVDDGKVKLGDIGILEFLEKRGVGAGMHGKTGDARWTAPEILEGQGHQWSSDVYSFGCLALFILRDMLPYATLKADATVLQAIYRGELPIDRHSGSSLDPTWKLCWTQDLQRRPTMSTILESLDSW